MKTLVICRVKESVDLRGAVAPHAPAELAALQTLKQEGALLEAYRPSGPGAILLFDGAKEAATEALSQLPLYRANLLDVELHELEPFPGFA